MSRQIKLKILSVIICLFVILIGLTLDTLMLNSIVISHYGGMSAIYSPYILSLTISMAVGIAFFVQSLLSLTNAKSTLLKLFFIIALASLSCFVFISVAWRLQVGMYGNKISDIFSEHIYYILVGAFVIQLLFLEKSLSNSIQKRSGQKSILGVVTFQITILLSASLLNIGSIHEAYERRKNEPNYMKGNSRIFRVVLCEECGISPHVKSEKTIIDFPECGLVILQADDLHVSECKFYFTNEDNKKQELYIVDIWGGGDEIANEYERKHNVKGVIYGGNDYIPFSEGGTYVGCTPSAISYWDLFVHSTDFSYDENHGAKMEIRTRSLVKECRDEINN
ncbi:MAG: hypothetical protein ACI93P_002322 [bacterium]|jgi:hypothetical protein